ncbi:AAA family ATPase [Reichenbachiella sp.]|uniref:AAA family ATPase n=1 Tax=Reichenbachiella sp. TaxID=2184521 RepID=UPI0032999A6C
METTTEIKPKKTVKNRSLTNDRLQPKNQLKAQTSNLKRVMEICRLAQEDSLFIALIAETSQGKTFGFNEYEITNENVYKVEITPSMTPKQFYLELQRKLHLESVNSKGSLWYLIEKNAQSLWELKKKSLVIVDEAGNFKKGMHKYIRELRDKTKGFCGIIMSGPGYFKKNMTDWEKEGYPGVPEVMSRINHWITLKKHNINDVRKICALYNITDEDFINQCDQYNYLSKIFDEVWKYLKINN